MDRKRERKKINIISKPSLILAKIKIKMGQAMTIAMKMMKKKKCISQSKRNKKNDLIRLIDVCLLVNM